MRILFLSHAYPAPQLITHAKHIETLAVNLARRGLEIIVLAPKILRASKDYEENGRLKVIRFSFATNEKILGEYKNYLNWRILSLFANCWKALKKTIRETKPELIHCHFILPFGVIGVLARKRFNLPLLVSGHGTDILVLPQKGFFMRALIRLVLSQTDALTIPAKHLEEHIKSIYSGARPEIIPMGVDTDRFKPEREKGNIIFSSRTFYPVYDIQTLLKAFSEILVYFPNYYLELAGDGPMRSELENLAERLKIARATRFLGRLNHNELAEHLGRARIYVSTSRSDGASVSLLEALACGAFPVVSRIPANSEWIKDGQNGLLFEPGNPSDLAAKLKQAILQYPTYSPLIPLNRELVIKNANLDIVCERFINLYTNLINAKDKAR